jgi:hypothetical protein
MFADWNSSDRPPLQTGIIVSQYRYMPRPRELGYTTLSVLLQSLWIYAGWLLLIAFDVDHRAITLVLAVTLFTGFIFLNSFFVWPKLLAAAYMLGFSAMLLPASMARRAPENMGYCVIAGALLSFGLLSHGGSAFALMGLVVALFFRGWCLPLRSAATIACICFLLYLPWMCYQKFFDPPGDRLLKWHIAGVERVDPQPFAKALRLAYRNLTLQRWIDGRKENAMAVFDHEREYWRNIEVLIASTWKGDAKVATDAAVSLRGQAFFLFCPNLGFLIVGPFALLAGIRRQYRNALWKASGLMWIYVICTLTLWCLVMFVPGSTIVHQGTYVAVLLAFAASILGLWAVRPWLAVCIGVLQVMYSFVVYGIYRGDSSSLPEGGLLIGPLMLFLLACFGLCVILFTFAGRMPHFGKQVQGAPI